MAQVVTCYVVVKDALKHQGIVAEWGKLYGFYEQGKALIHKAKTKQNAAIRLEMFLHNIRVRDPSIEIGLAYIGPSREYKPTAEQLELVT